MALRKTLRSQEAPARHRSESFRLQKRCRSSLMVTLASVVVMALLATEPVTANPKAMHSKVHHPKPHQAVHSKAHHVLPPPIVHSEKIEAQMEAASGHRVAPKYQKEEAVAKISSTPVQTIEEKPASNKKYRGHLKTKEVEGRSICETPECSMAAAQIISSMNVSVNPCDDFYSFACGGFIASHPAPPTSSTFDTAADLLLERLQLILETPAEESEPEPLFMMRRMYDACLDTDYMDSLGLAPLYSALSNLGGWPMVDPTWDESSYSTESSLALIRDLGFSPALAMTIEADIFDTSRKLIYIGEGTTGISESILSTPDNHPVIISAYKTFISDSAKQVRDYLNNGVTDEEIDAEVENLVAFETELARVMELSFPTNVSEVLELITIQQLQDFADSPTPGAFDYLTYLQLIFEGSGVTITADELVYLEAGSNYVSAFSTLLQNTPTRTLANYMAWMYTFEIGTTQTTYAMRDIATQFLNTYFGGYTEPERWYFCTEFINLFMGFPLSRAYVDLFFPEGAKEENEVMVEDIRSAFDSLLDVNDWLTPEDQVLAKEKLASIEKYVAYPEWIADDSQLTAAYAGLVVESDEHFDNLIRLGQYSELYDVSTYRDPPQHSFLMPPTIVNAFYDPLTNTITILVGILQIPFFQHNSLAALNYGGIGMVIGHEFTHGFDNSGRNFDKDGNLAPWMGPESIAAFDERAQCFVDQYNAFHPPEVPDQSIHVDGQQTLGENIADNGGIREAFQAYQLYVERNGVEPGLPGLDEFTPDQLFFLGNANVWCESKDASTLMNQIISDVHSPGRFRIIGPYSNDADFSRTWNCPAGSPMNRGEESCLLW